MAKRRRSLVLTYGDTDLDLVPLIDCVFLLLLFFMLCGHLTVSERAEQITVPPARTAEKVHIDREWRHEVINIGGGFSADAVRIRFGQNFDSANTSEVEAMRKLRVLLDQLYDISPAVSNNVGDSAQEKQVVLELRADGNVPWRTMQTIQQVIADSIDPLTGLPNSNTTRRPFTHLLFSTRPSDES